MSGGGGGYDKLHGTAARSSAARRGDRVLESYYLLTPVFWVMDALWQAPVRAAGIESRAVRWTYYAALVAIGLVCRLRPRWAPLLALAEGSGNLLMLMLAILLPIWGAAADPAAQGGQLMGSWGLANVFVVGLMTIYAIKRAEWQLWARSGRRAP